MTLERTTMTEISPNVGYGPLKLGMSPDDVALLIGAPGKVIDASKFDFLEPDERPFYKNQIIEERDPENTHDLIDLLYEKRRLVCINIKGTCKTATFQARPINQNRMEFISFVANQSSNIYIRSENYFFLPSGICISRAGMRKDINYVRIYDVEFKTKFLKFENYKPHAGPVIK